MISLAQSIISISPWTPPTNATQQPYPNHTAHPQAALIPTMIQTKIHLLTFIQGRFLLVYENARGHQFEALSPNGEVYHHNGIYYSASSAKAKGRQWIHQLTSEEF